MILIGIGGNLHHPNFGSPRETCAAALAALTEDGIVVLRRSRWFESAPVPPSDQPWFVNGVAQLATDLNPIQLMDLLHGVEESFGRVRRERNEARVLDLDLLAYDDIVSAPGESPILPHPRLVERAFVILPLADILPLWRHPASGLLARDYAAKVDDDGAVRPIEEEPAG